MLSFCFFTQTITSPLFGQSGSTGALTGTVKDSSGAVVPNATVTITNTGTNQVRTAITNSEGTYKFGFLPPGDYRVKFEASGFNTAEITSVTVIVTETPVLDHSLTVGGSAQQVEVMADAEAVQSATSTVGSVVAGRTMTELPLSSRNYTNLLGLAAGANTGVFNAANLGRGSQDIAVNGSSIVQNNYAMDGANVSLNMATSGNIANTGANPGIGVVNPDAIQEFKIQTSMFDAGYGRKPGASVNVVTKSGTNQFHGSAFEFFRNTALNANDYFRKMSPPIGGKPNNGRQRLDQHQFGGTFGGPAIKDKLFFFGSFQETRQKNGITSAGYSTPTLPGIPLGDRSNTAAFRAALGAAFCPTGTANAGTTGRTRLGGTQVACNGTNINPVAVNILQLKNPDGSYFVPSSSTGSNQNTTYSIPAIYKEHQGVANVDYLINSKHTLTGRYFIANSVTDAAMGCGLSGSNSTNITQCLPGSPGVTQVVNQYGVGKLTSILSNTVVNEARFSVQRALVLQSNNTPFTNTQVGMKPIIPGIDLLNRINVTGLFTWSGPGPAKQAVTQWEAADQISWSHGKHTTRAGFEYERDMQNWNLKSFAVGNLTFQTFQDFLLGLPGCAPGTSTATCTASGVSGQTTGLFTSNISSTGSSQSVIPASGLIHYYRAPTASAFLQDDFKVFPSLTLNLGVRWEYLGLQHDKNGQNTNIWPDLINTVPVPGTTPATGTLAGFVVPSNYNPSLYPAPTVGGLFQNNKAYATENEPSITNFAPRVGFAWKPLSTDRFVIRGGGGIFYDRVAGNNYNKSATQNFPYSAPAFASGAANYYSSFAQPYAQIPLGWTPRWVNLAAGTSSNLSIISLSPDYQTPTTYQWNLNIQYEVLPRWVLEIGYVGTRAVHQDIDAERQLNSARLASASNPINGITTNTVANASLRVPYLGFSPGGVGSNSTKGDTKFNSLQVTMRKQFSHGLQFEGAYTYSRAFTTTNIYQAFNDPNQPAGYGMTPAYRPHRFTLNYAYDLPLGKHDGLLGKLVNGWNVAGVTVIQNGSPLTILDGRGGSIYGFGAGSVVSSTAQYAPGKTKVDIATSGDLRSRLGGATGGTGYFDPAAFGSVPTIGNGTGFGNSGFGVILGPGQMNFDATLQKTTRVGGLREDASLVFRSEFFNLMNHAQFGNPTGGQLDLSSTSFGQITNTSVNPRLVQFALKYIF
jgi:hypothetical protein